MKHDRSLPCFSFLSGPRGFREPLPTSDALPKLWRGLPDLCHQAPLQPSGRVHAHVEGDAGERSGDAGAQPQKYRAPEWWVSPLPCLLHDGICCFVSERIEGRSSSHATEWECNNKVVMWFLVIDAGTGTSCQTSLTVFTCVRIVRTQSPTVTHRWRQQDAGNLYHVKPLWWPCFPKPLPSLGAQVQENESVWSLSQLLSSATVLTNVDDSNSTQNYLRGLKKGCKICLEE